ncbi:MAG: copper chaperone PCu(A)C [Campylobacter sp.]|nr:copper chaperone PCu(A)C [Campylobacter sp.]
MKKFVLLATLSSLVAFAGEISIEKIYAKESMKNAANGAVFLTIKNELGADVKLIGASSSVCDTVELHTHKMVDGMKMMTKIDEIVVPNMQSVELKPGGDHVMLLGLKKPLVDGDEIDIELKFDTGRVIKLNDVDVVNAKKLFLEK